MKKTGPTATLHPKTAISPQVRRIFVLAAAAAFAMLSVALLSCTGRGYADPVPGSDGGSTAASARAGSSGADGSAAPGSSGPVSASDDESWFLVTEVKGDTRNYTVYIDTSTIQTVDGEVMSWSKLVFPDDQKDSDGLTYREVRIASAINCTERTYMYSASKFYDALGRMVYNESIETPRSPIPGGTVSEYIANFVCGYTPPAPSGGSAPPPSK
ncbi:MAG: hypothetical protein KJ002_08385 [Candidatus Dadabacteria bacterium]|nr:hypothetical protein [Candidatus Dadabacteria bacterium]